MSLCSHCSNHASPLPSQFVLGFFGFFFASAITNSPADAPIHCWRSHVHVCLWCTIPLYKPDLPGSLILLLLLWKQLISQMEVKQSDHYPRTSHLSLPCQTFTNSCASAPAKHSGVGPPVKCLVSSIKPTHAILLRVKVCDCVCELTAGSL